MGSAEMVEGEKPSQAIVESRGAPRQGPSATMKCGDQLGFGKTPMQTFNDSRSLALEKQVGWDVTQNRAEPGHVFAAPTALRSID